MSHWAMLPLPGITRQSIYICPSDRYCGKYGHNTCPWKGINDLKGTRECRNKWLKTNNSWKIGNSSKELVINSVSMVNISLKHSTTRSTETQSLMILIFSVPQLIKLRLCGPPKPLHENACIFTLKLPVLLFRETLIWGRSLMFSLLGASSKSFLLLNFDWVVSFTWNRPGNKPILEVIQRECNHIYKGPIRILYGFSRVVLPRC